MAAHKLAFKVGKAHTDEPSQIVIKVRVGPHVLRLPRDEARVIRDDLLRWDGYGTEEGYDLRGLRWKLRDCSIMVWKDSDAPYDDQYDKETLYFRDDWGPDSWQYLVVQITAVFGV